MAGTVIVTSVGMFCKGGSSWAIPRGNVDLSAASGRDVIKDLCKRDGKPFQTDSQAARSPRPPGSPG